MRQKQEDGTIRQVKPLPIIEQKPISKTRKCLYYKDSNAGEELYGDIYEKFETEEERENEYEKREKQILLSFGELCTGDEHLYIEFDLNEPGTITVGDSKYKFIK